MKFASPFWLYGLIAVPLVYAYFLWDEARRRKQFTRFANQAVWAAIAPEADWHARMRKARVWTLALGFAILAMARPQWGSHEETIKVSGMDIMYALDVSSSMETEDVVPSRLKKAQHWIRSLTQHLTGDRVGVVAFAGSAYLACPLTTDQDYLLEVTSILNPSMVTNQGTDIGIGLDTARKALDRGGEEGQTSGTAPLPEGMNAPGTRAIILISDGEDHEDGAIDAASKLKELGVKLYVIGVGTERGGPIPVRDENGNLAGYKRDHSGQGVVSQFHPDALMQVAAASGGKYWNMTNGETEVDEVLGEIGGLSRSDYAERRFLVYEDRFQFPLALAVLLLFIEISLPARRLRREKLASPEDRTRRAAGVAPSLASHGQDFGPSTTARREGAVAAKALLGLIVSAITLAGSAFSHSAEAAQVFGKQPPLDVYLENEKGMKAYQDGHLDEARKNFGSAQALDPSRSELEYNRGVVQLDQNDADGAASAFANAAKQASGPIPGQYRDPGLAGKSFFNLGGALSKKNDYSGAVSSYLEAIEAAHAAGDQALEQDARKNLELLAEQKKQQGGGGDDQKPQDQDDKKDQKKQFKDEPRKQFKSKKLTPEDAERVMAELSNKERELQQKLKKQHGNPQVTDKDW